MMSLNALGCLGNGGAAAKEAARYYDEKGVDYYIDGAEGQEETEWVGDGAKALGLVGPVEKQDLQLAFVGYVGGKKVQNAGKDNRQIGWDLTFSAPKSVSVLWGTKDRELRRTVERLHRESVGAALSYVAEYVTTRRGYAGKVKEKARIVAAQFVHYTSRAGDPQLHTHVVIPNFCVRADGSVGTIESQAMYENKMAAGALYQAELAYRLRAMGYAIEDGETGTFRLRDVPKGLEEIFSKRAAVIDQAKEDRGVATYAGSRSVVTSTRQQKEHTSMEERLETWEGETLAGGYVPTIPRDAGAGLTKVKDFNGAVETAGEELNNERSTFAERDLIRATARRVYGEYSAREVIDGVRQSPRQGAILELIGATKEPRLFTTRSMMALEREMVVMAGHLAKSTGAAIPAGGKLYDGLTEEQKSAVLATCQDGRIAIVQGRAGTGKTRMMMALKEACDRAGWEIRGLAVAGQAAQNMQKETGIVSSTISSWQLTRKEGERTVFVLDEAGMVGSKVLHDLLKWTAMTDSKIVLVGDERQLQPIDAGGALHAIDREVARVCPDASSEVTRLMRVKTPWLREVVVDASLGNFEKVFAGMDKNGCLAIYENGFSARTMAANRYVNENMDNQAEGIILTNFRADAFEMNKLIRATLKERGKIKEDQLTVKTPLATLAFAVGDRVMFLENDYKLDVRNGQRGELIGIVPHSGQMTVKLDGGEIRVFSVKDYNALDYGWASTTHKSQGATVDRCYIVGYSKDSMASRQSTYVQLSRARHETTLFVVQGERSVRRKSETLKDPLPKGDGRSEVLKDMERVWSRDKSKDTSLDYAVAAPREQGMAGLSAVVGR